jgi:hypothetical protein
MIWSSRAPLEPSGAPGPINLLPLLPPLQATGGVNGVNGVSGVNGVNGMSGVSGVSGLLGSQVVGWPVRWVYQISNVVKCGQKPKKLTRFRDGSIDADDVR